MSLRVCLAADTHRLPRAGGHLWVYLNWALGLRAAGCDVVWLELFRPDAGENELADAIRGVRERLRPFGLADALAACDPNGAPLPGALGADVPGLDVAAGTELLLDVGGKTSGPVAARFRRSALVDIDPGLLQMWIAASGKPMPEHDVYFSIGETVGTPDAAFPDCGVEWHYTPVPIHLPEWSAGTGSADDSAPYTTVTSWWGWWEVFGEETFNNEKRGAFLEYLDLPRLAGHDLELALAFWGHDGHEDFRLLREHGWRVRDAFDVAGTPTDYRRYLETSRGEFSCAKPSCLRLRNAWLSDRTLSYMALGRPVVVQYTGPSRCIPDGEGIFRFRSPEEARRAIECVESDYQRHSRLARAFVEEHCDAARVVRSVLERALG